MIWTTQQQQAILSRDKNLLVAAAAGSGKTAVLVERISQMIIEGKCNVDEMLIVTFTNAAAQEMRTRIHGAIEKKIAEENDSELIAKLERQAILLSGASIMTFHSFCMSVIKRNFSKIDLDPKFREGNEHELSILKQEIIEELFEDKYSSDADFVKFSDEFGGDVRGDKKLYEIVLDLHNSSCSRPYPADWLNLLAENYEQPDKILPDGKTWTDFLFESALEEAKSVIENAFAEISEVKNIAYAQIIDTSDTPKKVAKFKENWNKLLQIFDREFSWVSSLKNFSGDWDAIYKVLVQIDFEKITGNMSLPDDLKTLKTELVAQRNIYKEKISELKKIFSVPKSEVISEIKNLAAPVRQLVELTKEFDEKFSAAKRERGIIDFNDMEHLALKIFNTDKKTAETYRKKFKVIMVDEYQDTNDVQEEIIGMIVRKDNFFAVGDVKQSIYKFRNAAPEIFMKKYKDYPKAENCERIDLSKNFRSRLQVVEAVNEIFCRLMTEDAMEIDYNKDAELNFGATEDYLDSEENIFDDEAEFLIIAQDKQAQNFQNSQDDDDEDDAEELDKLEKEIQVIAEKINSMIRAGKKVWDGKKKIYRPLEFRDVVILLRSTEGRATRIIDVLAKNKIPAYAEDKGGYFKAQEVQTILNLLNVLDNSRQDIPLAAVMLSVIGGFSAEELAELRIENRDYDLYTLVFAKSAENNPLGDKCKNFLIKLNYWREVARQISVSELLSKIYRETGFYDYFDNAGGKVAQANLRVLIDRAAEYEKTAFRGLSRFIQFIKKMRELNNDLSAARTLGENENLVRVMTIHKSKGLEFPVVFVAELGKKFNTLDLSKSVIAHRKLGLGICRVVEGTNGLNSIQTFPQKIIKNKIKLENLAEELRILYVAFTRAKEKLILVGTYDGKDVDKYDELAELEKIPPQILQKVARPIEWLLMIKKSAAKVIKTEIIPDSEVKFSEEKISEKVEEKISQTVEKLPPSPLENIPAKVSVTEVKRRLEEDESDELVEKFFDTNKIYRRPNFIQKKSLSPAELGTLTHSVMQHLNLSESLDVENISAQIDEMVAKKIFDEVQGEKLKSNAANIAKFFSSPIGKNLLSSKKIYRELPFSYYVAAEKIGNGKIFNQAVGEKIFIQGIIDLLFQNSAGKWILLDYKTDRENSDEHFIKEYREQIRLYVQAVENILNLKISEKYLYLLNCGREIKI